MRELAEDFMDKWLQANIADRAWHPRATAAGFARRCKADARKNGIPIDALVEVVGDVEQAIIDELRVKGVVA
jgi:hypothetical protein